MIVEHIELPPAEIVEDFRALLAYDSITCAISDCLGRFGAMTADMRPLLLRAAFSCQDKAAGG
jgi:4-hydroxy-4-methyl-2-oxoglutarate aldolase